MPYKINLQGLRTAIEKRRTPTALDSIEPELPQPQGTDLFVPEQLPKLNLEGLRAAYEERKALSQIDFTRQRTVASMGTPEFIPEPQPYEPSEPPTGITPEPSKGIELVERTGKQFVNRFLLDTIESWRPSSLYVKGSRINSRWMAEKREIQKETGRDWEHRALSDAPRYLWGYFKAAYGNTSRARQAIAQAKLQEKRGAYKIQLPPPVGVAEKGVDIAAGLSAFITKLWLLKKAGTGTGIIPKGSITGDMAVWEALGLAEQDIPGKMAGIRGGLGLIGKIPTGSVTGKTAKVIAESGLFGGVTAALGGKKEEIIIAALLPVAFNAWHFAKQRKYIINYEKSLKSAAYQEYRSRIKKGMTVPASAAHLKADWRIIDNAVARAKQKIYSDDAFAPARDKWEVQRQRALKMVASGNAKKVRIGNDILNFLAKRPGIPSETIETQIKVAKQQLKAIRAEKFKRPEIAPKAVKPVKPIRIAEKLPVRPPAPITPTEPITKAEPRIVKPHAVEVFPRKKEVLAEVEKAIAEAPFQRDYKKGTVHFEIDGGADILNHKEALQRFYKDVKALPEKGRWPEKYVKKPGILKPIAAKREEIGDLIPGPEGYFTDGRLIIKGKPPAKAKYDETGRYTHKEPMKLSQLNDILFKPTEPAELQHYAWSSPAAGKGVSDRPIVTTREDAEAGIFPLAVFKSEGRYYRYAQNKFNAIRNRFPDASYGINSEGGALIAYMGTNQPVAALMPIQIEEGEVSTAELPVDMAKPLAKEEVAAKMPEHRLTPEGRVLIESDIGQIQIPEKMLTGEYGDDLETIFYYGNFQSDVPQPKLQRSLSVGDTIEYRGHTLMVMPQGWRDITGLSDDAIEAIQTSENAIGLDASWRASEKRIKQAKEPPVEEEPSEFVPPTHIPKLDVRGLRVERKRRAEQKRIPKLDIEELRAEAKGWVGPKHLKNVVVDTFREWPKGMRKVGKDYWIEVMAAAKEMLTPYRYKALRQTMLGAFRYKKGVTPVVVGIEVQEVQDALTATHELSHNIDWLMNNKVFPSSIKGRLPDSDASELELRKELKKVSQLLRPDLWKLPKAEVKRHTELMADYISCYILDAEKAKELAPNVTVEFEAKIADKPELFDIISKLQESRYVGPEEPAVAEHIRRDFPLPKEFTPLQLVVNMTDEGYVKAAEELGLTAARHYKVLMQRARNQADRIDKFVPDKNRQTDLVVIAEKGTKNPWTGKTRQEIYAEGLTAAEIKAIGLFRAYQEQARQTVNKYLRGADIAEYIKFIEDYFIHAYHTPLTEKYKTAISKWAKRSPQAKKRVLPDLAKAVEIGLKPRAKTLSDGLRLWAGINYRVATNKAFLRILPQITNDDGVSILQRPKDYPHWPTVDYWPIRQNYAVPLPGRGILLFQGRVAIDPRVKPFIDAMFGRRVFNTPVRIIEGLNATWKAFQLTLFSLFHHQAEFFSACGSLGPRAMPLVGGYYGKRAQAFGKKPKLWGFLPAHITVLKAGKELEKCSEFMDDYLAHGGQRGYISTEGIALIERMLRTAEEYLENIIQLKPTTPLTGVFAAAYVPVRTARVIYAFHQRLLWDNVQRAKLVTYYTVVADGAKNSDLPIKDVKELAVKYINDNYGGQEWLNTIFRKPKTRQLWTQLMMSLDWTFSQIKTARWPFGITGKGAERRAFMRRIGRHHWFWYLSAVAAASIAACYAMSGKGPWENEKGHKLDIDWTNLWRSLPWNRGWKERGDYSRRYISMGKAGRELARWVTSPLLAFGYKLSPVARSTFEQATGYSVGSSWAEPWATEDMELYQEVYARFKHLIENFRPFAFSGNNAFLAFPSRKGMTRWKAVRSYEDIYQAKAEIAANGFRAKLTKISRILKANEKKLMRDIAEACKINQVDAEKARRAAVSGVRSRYYTRFWNAAKRQNVDGCNRYADALLELGITPQGFKQSLRYRVEQLPEEAKEFGIEALRKAAERR